MRELMTFGTIGGTEGLKKREELNQRKSQTLRTPSVLRAGKGSRGRDFENGGGAI